MAKKSINLVKKIYCENNRIKDPNALRFDIHRRTSSGDYVFLIDRPGVDVTSYLHLRVDMSGLSSYRTLDIPKEYQEDKLLNKQFVINWVQKQTGYLLLEEDISHVILSKDAVSVILAKDSMRFKNDFHLVRLRDK